MDIDALYDAAIAGDADALYDAAIAGDADAIADLGMKAGRVNQGEETILHVESKKGNTERVRFIVNEFANKNLLSKPGKYKRTALHLAAYDGHTEVVEILIGAATHLPVTSFQAFLRQGDKDMDTALHIAVLNGNVAIVKLLVEADPTDRHMQNDQGKTPMYIAVEKGFDHIVEIISTTCTTPSLDGPHGSTAVRIKNLNQAQSPGGTLYKIMDEDTLYSAAIAGDADAIAELEMQFYKMHAYGGTILHTECSKGHTERVRFILRQFASKHLLVKLNYFDQTALLWAASYGHTEVVEVLIDAARHLPPPPSPDNIQLTSFQAFLRQADQDSETALNVAVMRGHVAIAKLLLEADPSDTHVQNNDGKTPIYNAAEKGYNQIVKAICTTCEAPFNLDGPGGSTALHAAIKHPDHDNEVIKLLISAARHLPPSDNDGDDDDPVTTFQAFLRQADEHWNTALHIAVMQGNLATAKLLVEEDPSDRHTQNKGGKTPIYIAAERGYYDIVKMICTTCTAPPNLDGPGGSTTALHAAIENLDKGRKEDRDVIRVIIEAIKRANNHPDVDVYESYEILVRLFNKTDEKGCIILELAVEGNYLEVVEFILTENPAYHLLQGRYPDFIGIMPLIYKAKDKGYNDMVKLLTEAYQRGVQIVQRMSMSICEFKYMPELISAIRSRQEESVLSLLDDDNAEDLVTFVDNLGWTALHHAAYHEFDSIIHVIIEEQKNAGHSFVYKNMVSTPFHVAAERGYTSSTVIRLMPSWSSTFTVVDKNGQNMLHLAALQSKKEMIQDILKICPKEYMNKFVNEQNNNGDTPLHLLISRGCFVPQLLIYEGCDTRVENKKKWTPPDMLYFEDQIIDDQVQIKIALDSIQIDLTRDIFSSSVPPNKRMRKDVIFNKQAKLMIHEKYARMKEDTHAIANCFSDAIAGDSISRSALEMKAETLNESGETILHVESKKGDLENVLFIVSAFANKKLLVKLDGLKQTALHHAAQHGFTPVVEALIDAAKHLLPFSANDDAHIPVSSFQEFIRQANCQQRNTALHLAVLNCNMAIVKLLVEADPDDRHVQNREGKSPVYIAAENGYKDIVMEICTTCTALSLGGPGDRTTALHALIQNIGPVTEEANNVIRMMVNAVKSWSCAVDASLVNFEALFTTKDELGRIVLEVAVERNNVDAVKLILAEDPAYQHGHEIKRNSLMSLICKAIDNEYSDDIIKLLSETYEAGINPDHKDVLALILAIQRLDEDFVLRLLEEAKHLVNFIDDNGWTPLHYEVYHEFDSILDAIIKAQKDAGHPFVYGDMVSTPFHLAVKYGYTSTLVRLMELWPVSSIAVKSPYTVVNTGGRNILHLAAVADNRKEMVQGILKYCPEKYKDQILNQQDINGDTVGYNQTITQQQ